MIHKKRDLHAVYLWVRIILFYFSIFDLSQVVVFEWLNNKTPSLMYWLSNKFPEKEFSWSDFKITALQLKWCEQRLELENLTLHANNTESNISTKWISITIHFVMWQWITYFNIFVWLQHILPNDIGNVGSARNAFLFIKNVLIK